MITGLTLPSLPAWAAARLARGCGEQAFGEVKHLIIIIVFSSLNLGGFFLHHIIHYPGWESSHYNGHGVEHPPRFQPTLRGRDLSLDLPLKFCDHAIKCQYKLRLPKCSPDLSEIVPVFAPG